MLKDIRSERVSAYSGLKLSIISLLLRAKQALDRLIMPPSKAEPNESPKKAIEFFDQMEIYPGTLYIYIAIAWNSNKITITSGRVKDKAFSRDTQEDEHTILANGRSHQ